MTIIDQPRPDTTDSLERRVAELEAANARLMAKLEQTIPTPSSVPEEPDPVAPGSGTGNRRNLFKLAAGAAAGGTALALSKSAGPVAAADTDPIEVGATTTQGDTGRTTTVVSYTNPDTPQVLSLGNPTGANIMTVRDNPGLGLIFNPSSSSYPAALGGYSYSRNPHGVYGYTSNGGFGVVGLGSGDGAAGVLARGTRANIEMYLDGDAPSARTDAHVVGEIVADSAGDLWYCTVAGTPGTWQPLAGPNYVEPLTYNPVTPFRVYDSREESDGAFTGGENRTISVADARDVDSYLVVAPDAVPAGATAVTGNVVVIATTDTGFMSINPGGTTAITAATVNWGSGMNIGNAGTFALNGSREVEAVFGPGNGAHMTLDITGYYL